MTKKEAIAKLMEHVVTLFNDNVVTSVKIDSVLIRNTGALYMECVDDSYVRFITADGSDITLVQCMLNSISYMVMVDNYNNFFEGDEFVTIDGIRYFFQEKGGE